MSALPPAQAPAGAALPLFPLRTVLFPGGLLGLKVFEARYLDLVGQCLRERSPFGVVCLAQGHEVRSPDAPPERFEAIGVLAHLLEVDADQPGLLRVRCQGGQRFRLGAARQRPDGLWQTEATPLPDPPPQPVPPALAASAQALQRALLALQDQGTQTAAEPWALDEAGWVANRWCELLPIPLAARQKLLELDEPLARLGLVDQFLRGQGLV